MRSAAVSEPLALPSGLPRRVAARFVAVPDAANSFGLLLGFEDDEWTSAQVSSVQSGDSRFGFGAIAHYDEPASARLPSVPGGDQRDALDVAIGLEQRAQLPLRHTEINVADKDL